MGRSIGLAWQGRAKGVCLVPGAAQGGAGSCTRGSGGITCPGSRHRGKREFESILQDVSPGSFSCHHPAHGPSPRLALARVLSFSSALISLCSLQIPALPVPLLVLLGEHLRAGRWCLLAP